MKRWVIAGTLVTVVVAAAVVAAVLNSTVSVQIATVKRGVIREYIDERAKTRVPRVYRITTPQAGRIQEITLAEGSPVKQGQVVARIISEDLENAVDEARAAVERLDAAIVENDDVAVEKSLAVQAAEFVQSMNNTVEAAKAKLEAGTQLLTIGQLDALEIESDVLSQDVVRVNKGDAVELYGPAIGGGLRADTRCH